MSALNFTLTCFIHDYDSNVEQQTLSYRLILLILCNIITPNYNGYLECLPKVNIIEIYLSCNGRILVEWTKSSFNYGYSLYPNRKYHTHRRKYQCDEACFNLRRYR